VLDEAEVQVVGSERFPSTVPLEVARIGWYEGRLDRVSEIKADDRFK